MVQSSRLDNFQTGRRFIFQLWLLLSFLVTTILIPGAQSAMPIHGFLQYISPFSLLNYFLACIKPQERLQALFRIVFLIISKYIKPQERLQALFRIVFLIISKY